MTISEAERFYNLDTEKYILIKNKKLLEWINQQIDNGYNSFINIEELQNLIDKIVNWFEFKYPENQLKDEYTIEFEDIIDISKYMDFKQLLFRLTDKEFYLIKCIYMTGGGSLTPIYDNKGNILSYEHQIYMIIKRKKQNIDEYNVVNISNSYDFLLSANANTGEVIVDHHIENMIPYINNVVTLEDMLKIFEEKEELDYSELEKCIYNHKIDLELRKKVLQLVALKLIYSKNTIPEYGYERAKRYISEFKSCLPNLNLSIEEIDEIMKRDYSKDSEINKSLSIENNNSNIPLGQKIKIKLFSKK